jgi:hypothetical protein
MIRRVLTTHVPIWLFVRQEHVSKPTNSVQVTVPSIFDARRRIDVKFASLFAERAKSPTSRDHVPAAAILS